MGLRVVVVGGAEEWTLPKRFDEAGYDVEQVETKADALAAVDDTVDCVVTASELPDSDGLRVHESLQSVAPDIPVVFAPADGTERLAHEAHTAGVSAYVPSDSSDFERVESAVGRALDRRDATEDARDGQTNSSDALTTFFENIPAPAIGYEFEDGTPIIRAVNRSFTETFGFDADDVVGQSIDDVIVPEGKREEAETLDRKAQEGKQLAAELQRETTDGMREFLLRTIGVEADDADLDGYAIYVDITEQKERERALRRQNERLDEFASVVSHDLRNPLEVIKNSIEMTQYTGDLDHLDRGLDAVDSMDNLLRELLQLSRHGETVGAQEPVAIGSVARTAWGHVATDGASLDVESDGYIEADTGRLTQLLENLFINAVENAESTVRVSVGVEDEVLYVADDGPGIPESKRQQVFESGYSSDDEGTGFGLTIVRQVAQAHGWEIGLSTGTDGGARFEFRGVDVVEG